MPRYFLNLNIGDYLRDTMNLDATASGGYLHLLMHYTAHGKLPIDDEALARIARMDRREWRRNKSKIKKFFNDDWRQDRVERDLSKQDRLSITRKVAGQLGGLSTAMKKRARIQ
jgi:uncharacterized protein YdaU (DUF1376 family)